MLIVNMYDVKLWFLSFVEVFELGWEFEVVIVCNGYLVVWIVFYVVLKWIGVVCQLLVGLNILISVDVFNVGDELIVVDFDVSLDYGFVL